jgi:hypothetical protein
MNGGFLQMNCNAIRICSDQYHALAFGNSGTYNVGVNGPFLVGYNNGALGTSGTSFNNKSLEWSYTDVYIYKRLDMCNNNITNVGRLEGNTSGNLSIYAASNINMSNNAGAQINLNTDGSIYLQTTGANKTVYINAEAMTFSGGSNNRINDLGHIYGNTSAPGGGLGIDYMYGLFFNSAGNNANLFASGTYLNMNNYNGGTNIGCYNAAGTGDLALYSASNSVVVGTGAGHNIAINSGSNIYLNAAGSDGLIAFYTSTMNTYTLQDTNITALRNMTLRADQPGNSITSIASTISLIASSAINLISPVVNRTLVATQVNQPVIQYGTATGSGASGSVNVSLPVAYTSATSYIVTASMMDVDAARMSVNRNSASNITIYWFQAGSGTQTLGWTTMGN